MTNKVTLFPHKKGIVTLPEYRVWEKMAELCTLTVSVPPFVNTPYKRLCGHKYSPHGGCTFQECPLIRELTKNQFP